MAFSYFNDENLCENCFVVVNGKTSDIFVDQSLMLTDVRFALSRYLRGGGFDAVIFVDSIHRLYALDTASARIMRGMEENAGSEASPRRKGGIDPADGPFGHSVRRRNAKAPTQKSLPEEDIGLSFGEMSIAMSFEQSMNLLYHSSKKIALVLANVQSLQYEFTQRISAFFSEMAARRTDNPCAIIFLYYTRTDNDDLSAYAESGTEVWRGFYSSFLSPSGGSAGVTRNLRLGSPLAAEIGRLMRMMSYREQSPLRVRVADIPALSRDLAYLASSENYSLKEIYRRLSGIPWDTELTQENWEEALGLTRIPTGAQALAALVGLADARKQIEGWARNAGRGFVSDSRFEPFGSSAEFPLYFALSGRHGTGKRTLAHIIGQLAYEKGLLPQATFMERSASTLFGSVVGGTLHNVMELAERALGGTLYITDAGAMLDSAYGKEAVDALCDAMKTFKGQISVILSDTDQKLTELFAHYETLASLVTERIDLPDLTPSEFGVILRRRAAQGESPYSIEENTLSAFCEGYVSSCRYENDYSNAITAIRLAEDWRGLQKDGKVTPAELPEALHPFLLTREERLQEAMDKIESIIGLGSVKNCLRDIFRDVSLGKSPLIDGNKHFIFHGNPGTGKTFIAESLAPVLQLLGIIPRNHMTVVNASTLLSADNPIGELEKQFDSSRGGVFFLDEAHQLNHSDLGKSLIKALVPMIEGHEAKQDTCVICAGYSAGMRSFLRYDEGMHRRFPESLRLHFTDYTAGELTQILKLHTEKDGLVPTEEYLRRSQSALSRYLATSPQEFGNAGFIVDTFLPGSCRTHNERIAKTYCGDGLITSRQADAIPDEVKASLTADDLPEIMLPYSLPISAPVPKERTPWDAVDELVGKDEIREFLEGLRDSGNDVRFTDESVASGCHFAITGPSGSGRRTAASAIAGVLHVIGRLESRSVIFVSKGDLEAEYVGHTVQKTREVIDKADGGTLVVVNPSTMVSASSDGHSFGPEALGAIAGAMSSGSLSVIFVDTEEGMELLFRHFTTIRGSLRRSFTLKELSPVEMKRIFHMKCDNSMCFEPDVEKLLHDFFFNWVSSRGGLSEAAHSWCNAQEINILLDDLRTAWSMTKGQVITADGIPRRLMTREMFPARVRQYLRPSTEISGDAYDTLMNLTGLHTVKTAVEALRDGFQFSRCERMPGCYSFIGNPGTGKTKVARLMGGFLRNYGLLEVGHCIERSAQQLLSDPVAFDEAFRLAKNGVLFIDEFHQLRNYHAGQVIIDKLVKLVEDEATCRDHCVIIAGYSEEMMEALSKDKGLSSRFGKEDSIILFEDYTPEELLEILDYMAGSAASISELARPAALVLTPEYRELAFRTFRSLSGKPDFGNARFVRNLLADSIRCQYRRFSYSYRSAQEIPDDVYNMLTADDFPERWKRN